MVSQGEGDLASLSLTAGVELVREHNHDHCELYLDCHLQAESAFVPVTHTQVQALTRSTPFTSGENVSWTTGMSVNLPSVCIGVSLDQGVGVVLLSSSSQAYGERV